MKLIKRMKPNNKVTGLDITITIILIILSLLIVLPFYNVVIRSFATPRAVNDQLFYLIPTSFDLSSYSHVFMRSGLGKAFITTIFLVIFGTAFNMFLTASGAYALSKKNLPGRKIFMLLIIFTMLFNGGLIPFYLTMKNLGLINSYFAMILPAGIDTFLLFIMLNHFKSVPPSLEESAILDGANDIQILIHIILPVSKATIAAVGLFYAVGRWNEWWLAMFLINDAAKFPLQLVLREIINSAASTLSTSASSAQSSTTDTMPEILQMAAVVITIVPIMCVYPFIQPYFASGVMVGSVKG
ncbi:MAG: carbohydrate ABC transporter permease [Spirochaetaceae bacterium]